MAKPPVPAHIEAVLAKANPAVIGTARPDGAPVTVATWYVWDNGRVLVNMDGERRRLHYLRSDPRVSLTVLDGTEWYRHVSLQGRVVSLEDDTDFSGVDRLSRHYTGSPYPNRDRARVSAWIEVEAWNAWGFDRS